MTVEILPATAEHAERLAPRLRAADRAEIQATSGRSPLNALLNAIKLSDDAWTVLIDGEPMAMWGVSTLAIMGRTGCVWALTGDLVEKHPKTFMRIARAVVPVLLERWPRLVNAVDARYEAALRWVRRLGFTVEPAEPWGIARLPFHRISIERPQPEEASVDQP